MRLADFLLFGAFLLEDFFPTLRRFAVDLRPAERLRDGRFLRFLAAIHTTSSPWRVQDALHNNTIRALHKFCFVKLIFQNVFPL